jgi:hypothetical protein
MLLREYGGKADAFEDFPENEKTATYMRYLSVQLLSFLEAYEWGSSG